MKLIQKITKNDDGAITIYTCFFVVAIVVLISFLLLYASVQINIINIRNGVKMELNNLSASIYADTFRSQRESNFVEYIGTLYSSAAYTRQLEIMLEDGLENKVSLSNEDYQIRNIHLVFNQVSDGLQYVFTCNVEFYISMFGNRYPAISRDIQLTGHHNTKF